MAKIVITKTVDLGFLGEDYAGTIIKVRSISMRERDDAIAELDKIGKDEKASFEFVKKLVQDRFVSGIFKDTDKEPVDLTKEDLLDFPSEVFIEIMAQLQGRTDPKS